MELPETWIMLDEFYGAILVLSPFTSDVEENATKLKCFVDFETSPDFHQQEGE